MRQEKLARGEELKEEDFKEEESEEEIDYNVIMQEEETVPEGQEAEEELEQYFEGKPMRKVVRN